MPAVIVLLITFSVGFILRFRNKREIIAWLISCAVMPAFIIFDEFVMPYKGGGASMWPLPLIIGGFYGILAGGLGVVIASLILKKRANST